MQGNEWEKNRLQKCYNTLRKHNEKINKNKLFMGSIDGMLTKYGAVLTGYAILGLPVFGPGSKEYLKK